MVFIFGRQTLALVEWHHDTGYDIVLLEARSGRVQPFLNSRFNEMAPEFSPDGRWIAYASDESKRIEVYVRPFPGPGMQTPGIQPGGRPAAVGKKWETAFLPMGRSSVGCGRPD